MLFNKTDRPEIKTEARDVMILKFGKDGRGDIVVADGAIVPDEVNVYVNEKSVGRATLHTREDGIHADIMLSFGSLTGMDATAIASVKTFKQTLEGREITGYEITGVGLTPEDKVKVDNAKEVEQPKEQSQEAKESGQ